MFNFFNTSIPTTPVQSNPESAPSTIISKVEFINDHFKIPITFVKNSNLKDSVANDLELVKTIDASGNNPIFHYAFQPKTKCGEKVLEQVAKYYTTDVDFLQDTQKVLQKYSHTDAETPSSLNESLSKMITLWDEVKNDTGFKDKYYYLDWSFLEYLNKSESFLQILSMYSMSAPIISLTIPIFILIIPFFIIKARGLNVTVGEYVEVLKIIAANHAIGKLFTQFTEVSMEQKIYLVLSAAFYVFSIYQNCLSCIKFHKNMHKIYGSLKDVRDYLDHTVDSMEEFLSNTETFKSYSAFQETIRRHLLVLTRLKDSLDKVLGEKLSIFHLKEVGSLLKHFYELYQDPEYNESFMYSFGLHGYLDTLRGLGQNIKEKKMSLTTFKKVGNAKTKAVNDKNKNKAVISHGFKKAYYGPLINKNHVKNDLSLDKSIIITGPNASGKTTILKTTLINVILSQQMGCGFFKTGKMMPYNHIHCYLNIPDTSGRDSLFQAEARRCKEIIDSIHENKKDKHFCVFDELYSGTNPDEAVTSALRFMEYLVKFTNVKCLLTTHFIRVCRELDENEKVENFHMKTIQNGENSDDFTYTYSLEEGISEVRGGMKVLKDMDYPDEILRGAPPP